MKKTIVKTIICIITLSIVIATGLGISRVLSMKAGFGKKEPNEKIEATNNKNDKDDKNKAEHLQVDDKAQNTTDKDKDLEKEKKKKEEEQKAKKIEEEKKENEKKKIEAIYTEAKDNQNQIDNNTISQIMKARQAIAEKYGSKYKNVICIPDEKVEAIKGDFYVFGENIRGEVNKDKLFLVDKNTFEIHNFTSEQLLQTLDKTNN